MKTKFQLIMTRHSQNCIRRPFFAASLLVAAGLLGQNLRAADVIWTGGSGNIGTDWGTSANWSPAGVPSSTANAVFNGTSLSNVCYIDMGVAGGIQQVGSITLNANQGSSMTIGNSSSTTPGTLVLNGVGGTQIANNSVGGGELIIENGLAGATGGTNLNIGLAASGAIYSSSTLVASTAAGRISIYSVISDYGGSHGITLTGPGNVYLRGTNTYSGDTTILNGALELDAVGTAGNGNGTIFLSGGNIQSGASRNGYSSGNFIANPIVLTADAHIFNSGSTANSTRNIPFSGSLSGSAGTLIICNPTSVSGNNFIPRFSGSFTFNRPVVIGDTSADEFADNTLSFSGLDMCNASTNGAQTWNGIISGPGSLYRTSPIKDNSVPGGTCFLTGNNTFSGGTTIQSGSLFANNTAGSALGSGAVTVNNQGTLAGNGAVLAPVAVSAVGTIAPGSTSTTIGNLTVSSLANGPGGNYNWQISSTTGTPGTAWDLITCSSGWTDASTSISPNVVHLFSSGPPTGWNNATAYTWLIISNNPANSPGFNAANWTVDTTDFGGTAAGSFSVSTDANGSLDLVYAPLPNSNPVAHMVSLAPGETPTFGVAPGKTGSPTTQNSTVPYSVTVDALDASYHLCTNSFDTVGVISSANGDTLPAITPLVNGTITLSVANNTVGSTTLTATNITEGSAVPTGSSTVPVNINGTTTTLVSSANPAGVAIPIDLTAFVNSSAANITGTVTFKNGTVVIGTLPVTPGQTATIRVWGGAGTNSITATYNGDSNNSGSTSSVLTQVIQVGAGGAAPVGSALYLEDGQDYPLEGNTTNSATAPSTVVTRPSWYMNGNTAGLTSAYIKILASDLSGATVPDIRPLTNTVNPEAFLQIAKAGTNAKWYYRNLSNNVSSGSVYFSFLLKVTANPTTTDEYMGSMQVGGSGTAPLPTDPLTLHARGGTDSTHFNLGIQRLNGDEDWSGPLSDNTTYLVVLKYTFGPSGKCNLYINPTPGAAEPGPTASASTGGTPEPANIGTVLFYEAGSAVTYLTSGTYQYDVMRADTNWATVTPSIIPFALGATTLKFTSAPQTNQVNQNSALITVGLFQSNTTFNATADTSVALSSSSGGGTFLSSADGTTVISSVTISNGTSTAAFYYKDSIAGNPTLTGASGLLTPATQSETVTGSMTSMAPSFPPGGIGRLSSGNISLIATGALGTPYRLWATTNLALRPVISTWTLLNSSTITTSPFTNTDLTATNFSQRFYLFTSP